MAINEPELGHVVQALQREVGRGFANAWQPARDRVVLRLGTDTHLLLVPRGPNARLHSVPGRGRNPKKPFSFQGALRAHLSGPLTALTKLDGERVVDLHFGPRRLHLRLTGRSGGLWLVEGDRVIAAYDGPAPDRLPDLAPPPPSQASPRFTPMDHEDWDRAARRWFTAEERRQHEQGLRIEVERALRRLLTRTRRLLEHLEGDLDRASKAPSLRHHADTLAAHLHEIPRGASQAALPDLYDPDITVYIPLDPTRSAASTMEALYRKAGRLDRVGDRVLERMEDVERRLDVITEALESVGTAAGDELDALARLVPRRRARPGSEVVQPWHCWVGPGGQRVLVGKNAKGNRRLTFQVAKGGDWWMHLRGRPGAHLILPMTGARSPSLELLMAAAQIALIQGGVPEGASADVQYTQIRNVRSIPGEADGKVRVHGEKVLHVTREPALLVGWTRDDLEEDAVASAAAQRRS